MSPIITMPPQIRLACDDCGDEPGNEEFGGYFTFDADDPEKALADADYRRDGALIICDNCAFKRGASDAA